MHAKRKPCKGEGGLCRNHRAVRLAAERRAHRFGGETKINSMKTENVNEEAGVPAAEAQPSSGVASGSAAFDEIVKQIAERLQKETLPGMKDEPWLRKALDEAKAAHMQLPQWAKETKPPNVPDQR